MFCKKCGKDISDDSLFCQYCGEQLSEAAATKKQERKGLLRRFQSLSKGWQICLMSYVCWAFLWIILCSTEAIDESDWGPCILLFVIVLPVLALFIWYYFTHLRKKSKKKLAHKDDKAKGDQQPSIEQEKTGFVIFTLLQFAKEYGKMQVRSEKDNGTITSSYCVFTNSEGKETKVDFTSSTNMMSATDISQNKEHLFVVRNPGQEYILIEI